VARGAGLVLALAADAERYARELREFLIGAGLEREEDTTVGEKLANRDGM